MKKKRSHPGVEHIIFIRAFRVDGIRDDSALDDVVCPLLKWFKGQQYVLMGHGLQTNFGFNLLDTRVCK